MKLNLVLLSLICLTAFGETRINTDQLILGNKTHGNVDKTIQFEVGSGSANPKLKWNSATSQLSFANDGATFNALGSGSGGSGINYILNGNAESNATGWSAYQNTAQPLPVNGTGGTPVTTFTRSTSSPLRGFGSFLITKDANNRQGEGASYPFVIDSADKSRVMFVTFDYAASANFAVSNGQIGSESDIEVFAYDTTNLILLPVSPNKLTIGSPGIGRFNGSFQTSANSTNYRLIFHVATTNALAWTLKVDNVTTGPAAQVNGAPVTAWQSTPFTGTWSTNTTYSGVTRRVGDSLEADVLLNLSGAPDAVQLKINMPAGLNIDSTKLGQGTFAQRPQYGFSTMVVGASPVQYATFATGDSTSTIFVSYLVGNSAAIYGGVTNTAPVPFVNGNYVNVRFMVPIVGWGSTVQLSQDADVRVTAMVASGTPANVAANQPIIFPVTNQDTHGGYSVSTGKYTVSSPGYYRVSAYVSSATTTAGQIYAAVNNVQYGGNIAANLVNGAVGYLSGSTVVFATSGQTIDIRPNQALSTLGNGSQFSLEKVTGPATIAASETVAFSANDSAGQSINVAATNYIFPTKSYDTHGGYNASTGVYTVPTPGKYTFKVNMTTTGVVFSANQNLSVQILKNGVVVASGFAFGNGGTAHNYGTMFSHDVQCLSGDLINVQVSSTVASISASGAPYFIYFDGIREGNY